MNISSGKPNAINENNVPLSVNTKTQTPMKYGIIILFEY
jgi:hypothetical protein